MAYSEAQRKHYERNKEKYRASGLAGRRKREAVVEEAKRRPCADCSNSYPTPVMHLHHRAGEEKVGSVAELVRNRGMETVLGELEKCDVLCANCHILRHVADGSIGFGYSV